MMVERSKLLRTVSALAIAAVLTLSTGAAIQVRAESLMEALASAYDANPTILQERAKVRGVDEQLAQAQAGYRPQITAGADYGVSTQNTSDDAQYYIDQYREARKRKDRSGNYVYPDPSEDQIKGNRDSLQRNDGFFHPYGVNIQLQQRIFDGFSTLGAVREAESTIKAARENLRSVEQRVLFDAVRAYASVIRDRTIATLREDAVKILSRELAGTRERFSAGDLTRTDVSQAETRKARAIAEFDLARANLRSSLAEYERAVGHPADSLTPPAPADGLLPASLDEAIAISSAENPDIVEAAFMEQASVHEILRIRGELLPQVTLNASHQERYDFSNTIDNSQNQSVTARVSMPLYTGGDVESRIRAAKQQRQGRLEGIEQARQQMRAQTISAWSQLVANRSQVEAVEQQMRSAGQALDGVREEHKAGQRSVLDVLNAEQELLDSKIAIERARRDMVVASYAVLNSIGRLTAAQLGLSAELYDPEVNYAKTNGRAWGVKIERDDQFEGVDGLMAVIAPGWAARTTH